MSAFSERMDTAEAATYTGLTSSTLTKKRVFGGGPKYIKAGKRVIYDRSDLDAWMASLKRASTSENSHA
jgi:predicted DNA-binding transcriptional regulator AlpA